MALWEGLLLGRSYPRLSPSVLSCVGSGTTKKTCTLFIPALFSFIPQVIPDFIHPAKAVWKSRWKNGGLPSKKPLSNLNLRKVVHKNDSKYVALFSYKYFYAVKWIRDFLTGQPVLDARISVRESWNGPSVEGFAGDKKQAMAAGTRVSPGVA